MDQIMSLNLRCTTCGKPLLVGRGGDKRVLRTRIIIFNNGTTLAKCRSCKTEIVVPVKLADEFLNKPTAPQAGGSSKPERKEMGAVLDELARDLETLCGPFSARVKAMLAGEGGRTTKAQIEKLRGCKVHIHQLEELIEHVLSVCDSSSALAGSCTGDKFQSRVAETSESGKLSTGK